MNQCDYFFNDVNGWILVFTSYFNIFTLCFSSVLIPSAVQLIFLVTNIQEV